jgi:hypothetical protein
MSSDRAFPLDLAQVIRTLRTAPGVAEEELAAALRDVQQALAGGQIPESVVTPATDPAAPPAHAARGATAGPLPHAVVLRTSPVPDLDPHAPAWVRAMRPAARRGPFLGELGQPFWIDTFPVPRLVTVLAQTGPMGTPVVIARVPVRGRSLTGSSLRLGPGSAWLATRALVPGRPANEFAGVRIKGGTLRLAGTQSTTGDSVTVGGAWELELRLSIDAPPNPEPADGPGADATAAQIALPDTAAITMDRNGPRSIQAGDASASLYGSTVRCSRSPEPPFHDGRLSALVIPYKASAGRFSFDRVASTIWSIRPASAILRSGWALPIAVIDPQLLGEAAGAGSVWLELGPSLSVGWKGLTAPAKSPQTVLSAAPGSIAIWSSLAQSDITHRLRLWDEPATQPLRQSGVEVSSTAGSTVVHVSQPGLEGVIFAGRAGAHLDRPLAADGGRLPLQLPSAWFLLIENAAGTTAAVLASDAAAAARPHIAFALENAFVKARPPEWLSVSGPLAGDQLTSGTLLLRFKYRFVLPTLPDPYAANVQADRRQDVDAGWATASVAWAAADDARVAFAIQTGPAAPREGQGGVLFGAERVARTARLQPLRVLVDVSSNADQFGVALPGENGSTRVAGLSLVAPARDVAVLTLPPISWEPMLTKTPEPASGDVPLPPPPHDGGPALLAADTVALTPVAPIPLLASYHEAIDLKRHMVARLPLPFGLIAHVDTRRVPQPGPESTFGGRVFSNAPVFSPTLAGGRQVALLGPAGTPDASDPMVPGFVEPRNEQNYALGVLSQNILTRFDGDFGAGSARGIPLRRYELSGYGASLLSDWRDPEAAGPAIIQARFDVLVGRTAHEVIQMQSFLDPYDARVVRTITIDRRAGGWVLREDSGWVATSDGRFNFPGDPNALATTPAPPSFSQQQVHRGPIEAVVNIRNIRLDGPQFPVPARPGTAKAVTWQPVRFDADVLFAEVANPRLVVAQGAAGQRVPSRNLTGWIQIDGPTYQTKSNDGVQIIERVRRANGFEILDLLAVHGPAAGPIDCQVLLGGTGADPGLQVRASSMDVSCGEDSGIPRLTAAVRGSPLLPRDGAWSVARLGATDTAPNALDPKFPVPVVRPNDLTAGKDRWHLADPADILQLADAGAPRTVYGFVQGLGAQKVFFARPRVGNDPQPIVLPKPPQLADMGALLNAAGIFPGLADAFDFKTLKSLSVANGQVGFTEQFAIGTAAQTKQALLADLGGPSAIQLVIEYHDEKGSPTLATVTVAPASSPRWSIALERVAFTVRFNGSPLIRLFARVKADEQTAPTVQDLNVRYEAILSMLQAIFTNVQQVARFLPGGGGAGLRVGFAQGHLTVRNDFALPNLPLGAGQITDVAVAMGFEVALTPFDVRFVAGLGSSEKPFRWIVSPLAGTGVVQVGISKQGLDVLVQGGIGLGLAIDLGIAAGSASVTIAMELNTGPDPFELKFILSGRASVDVLRGLASATITLAAGVGIIPPKALFQPPFLPPSIPPPSPIPSFTIGLTASVAVGIHISICWVVDVDFDGYWQFRQDITTPAIPIPLV